MVLIFLASDFTISLEIHPKIPHLSAAKQELKSNWHKVDVAGEPPKHTFDDPSALQSSMVDQDIIKEQQHKLLK